MTVKGKSSPRELRIIASAALVALAAVGMLTWNVWRQVYRLQELQAVEAELVPLVGHAQKQNQDLRQRLEHVSSPGYVEEWARADGGMTLRGEVRLVVPTAEKPPTPSATPAGQPPPTLWQNLWQLLFGD